MSPRSVRAEGHPQAAETTLSKGGHREKDGRYGKVFHFWAAITYQRSSNTNTYLQAPTHTSTRSALTNTHIHAHTHTHTRLYDPTHIITHTVQANMHSNRQLLMSTLPPILPSVCFS